mmetsp:Transcript_16278/g.23243  ORF Transcript_16278/g.23243 Transcript_16278/m.23243 type:complete len:1324 (-) Transcript_16278:475-4446(-)|eukprot:CAMPEP_0172436058 /NCGR_PEP_ID=MMETSP1064-20121228/71518_1 /TAXON_ID=202472 /ORGANISM="Aulacoseira subarctica , Strain CCAP 1002/5" /LENGTH=1323 /DNA_ID=CAMNT_0013184441 /DNA_START=58 /DNA_END=4029 /DNA_ORIENTATION=+
MSDNRSFSVVVNDLLKKTEHYDKDERYMATSDLCVQLQRHTNNLDALLERRICSTILSLLNDDSNDVQAVAVKTLGVLLTVVQQDQVVEIAQRLQCLLLDPTKKDLRDVYTIGLRTLIKTVPSSMGYAVSERLYDKILSGILLSNTQQEEAIVLSSIDVLTELLARFGTLLTYPQQEAILHALMTKLLLHNNNNNNHQGGNNTTTSSTIVKRRASDALGCASVVISDMLLMKFVDLLLQQILVQQQQQQNKDGDARAVIRTMCVISGAVGHRLAQRIPAIVPIFLNLCPPSSAKDDEETHQPTHSDDDEEDDEQEEEEKDHRQLALTNELRESCFSGFESFVNRCPVEIMPYLSSLIDACLAYMCFDPNYTYDELEEEEDAQKSNMTNYEDDDGDNNNNDNEFSDEEDLSDDDDESWKLRRAAIRCLAAIVEAMKNDPAKLWSTEYGHVAQALVKRFKERVENCRVDVMDCFSKLLSYTIQMTKTTTTDTNTEEVLLRMKQMIPSIVASCERQLSNKKNGERTKSSALSLLSTTCQSPFGLGGAEQIASVLHRVKILLKDPQESKAIKLEALRLVKMILTHPTNATSDILVELPSILPELCQAVQEDWYKIIAEALRVLTKIPDLMARYEDSALFSQTVASSIYAAIGDRLRAHDLDQEIKECSLSAAASLLQNLHEYLTPEERDSLLSVILERLKNEITRVSALKTLSIIASPGRTATQVDLIFILPDSVRELSSLLRQQSRTLKQHTLEALKIMVLGYGTKMDSELYEQLLKETATVISDSDLHVSHLGLQVSVAVIKTNPSTGPLVRSFVFPQALILSTSPLLQDLALTSLLEFFEAMIVFNVISVSEMHAALLDKLPKDNNDALASKHAIINVAKCIAVTTCSATNDVRNVTVVNLIQSMKQTTSNSNPILLQLNLLTSGEIGQRLDVSQLGGSKEVARQLLGIFLLYLDDPNEEIKTAAAYALGRAAVGSKEVFLPPILEAFESSAQKKQYLLLSSLKEVVKCHQKNRQDLSTSVSVIVPHLIGHFSAKEEGVRKMVADCIGSLCILQPKEILPLLQTLTIEHAGKPGKVAETDSDEASEDALICWTIATSIKNAVSNKAPVSELQPFMPTFLVLLKEEDLTAKLAALFMVYASVHHSPQLLNSLMKENVLPSLQDVAQLNLKRVVDLGPFKHTVDDALPLRKAALSIFSTSLENCPDMIDIMAFIPILVKACDDVDDIQLQAHHILLCMCSRHPEVLVTTAELFVDPLEKSINKKKGTKTGTELERVNEIIKSALRVTLALSNLEGVSSNRKFMDFVDRTTKNSKNDPLLQFLAEER